MKVPWDRVFVYRDTDMCRAQLHDTPAHVFQNYQAQIRLSVKLRFLTGLARGIAETIGTINLPTGARDAGQAGFPGRVDRGAGAWHGGRGFDARPLYLPNKHLLYAAQVQSQEIYPQAITTLRELAGGALLMLPSSVEDFSNPELARIISRSQISPAMSGAERVKLMKLTWDAVGLEFASRHLQYEMFYAGAQFVTRGHSFRTYDWDRACGLSKALMGGYDLPDFAAQGENAA